MSGHIVEFFNKIMSPSNNTALGNDHRTNRHFIQLKGMTGLCQCITHKEIIVEHHATKVSTPLFSEDESTY